MRFLVECFFLVVFFLYGALVVLFVRALRDPVAFPL